jgi:hypothetical protein
MAMAVLVTGRELYRFFRELAEPLDPVVTPQAPKPEALQRLFELAARYQYWMGSPSENAAIGIQLG